MPLSVTEAEGPGHRPDIFASEQAGQPGIWLSQGSQPTKMMTVDCTEPGSILSLTVDVFELGSNPGSANLCTKELFLVIELLVGREHS